MGIINSLEKQDKMNFIKRFALLHLTMNACDARKKVDPKDLPL